MDTELLVLRAVRFNGVDLAAGETIPRLPSAAQERNLVNARIFRVIAVGSAPQPEVEDGPAPQPEPETEDGPAPPHFATHAAIDAYVAETGLSLPDDWATLKLKDKQAYIDMAD